jgi:hypothetical protein
VSAAAPKRGVASVEAFEARGDRFCEIVGELR